MVVDGPEPGDPESIRTMQKTIYGACGTKPPDVLNAKTGNIEAAVDITFGKSLAEVSPGKRRPASRLVT
jgi:hypothetical protein